MRPCNCFGGYYGKIDPADLPHQTEQSPAFYTSPAGVKVGKTELGGAAVAARRETAEEFGLSVDMGQMKLLDVYDEPSSWLRKQAIWRSGYGKVRRFYCFGGVVTPEQAACAAAGDDMLPGSLRRIPLVQLAAADRRDFAFNGMHLLLWSKFWNEKTDGFKVAARSSS